MSARVKAEMSARIPASFPDQEDSLFIQEKMLAFLRKML